MRDPAGHIIFYDNFIIRHLNNPADSDHFLHSKLARSWVQKGLLIPYEWIDSSTIKSPRLPFVTLPTEWTRLQFVAAARLTLDLKQEAVEFGWDLKDASAWNIVFDGLRPVFVDLLSFIPIRSRPWLATGQFSRHFLLPLLLNKYKGIEPGQCFRMWRDGIPIKSARQLIGFRRFLSRYWPLMITARVQTADYQNIKISNYNEIYLIQQFRIRMLVGLKWMLDGVRSIENQSQKSAWGNYEYDRPHYSEDGLKFKKIIINEWIKQIGPEWVLDVGCNAGEFSKLAVANGSKVICWDADSAAMDKLYTRHYCGGNVTSYYPVLHPVDDIAGGRGWMGSEYPSLIERLQQRVDLVLLLAIIHHLAIAGGVRLVDIFKFVIIVSKGALLLEILSENDERVIQLCLQYNRDPEEFTIEKQLDAAIVAGFRIVLRVKHKPVATREYVWLEPANLTK